MSDNASLDLQRFYPPELEILSVEADEGHLVLRMRSNSTSSQCPRCHAISEKYHGTYHRLVQDIPIFLRTVWLDINAREYRCENPDCPATSFAETFHGFLGYRRRMTERCMELVCTLALQTSCEGCAMICRKMGLRISGDTVIRMLLDFADRRPAPVCGESIGVDDFAYRKGHSYCTVIVNEEDRVILDILEGRDGESLREWLKDNRHVRTATRDRAGAYAKAISEVLPDARQIADRFHLHHNLMECVRMF